MKNRLYLHNWFRLRDETPRKEGFYLIATPCGMVITARWFEEKREFMNSDADGWVVERATHWAELPKHPAE